MTKLSHVTAAIAASLFLAVLANPAHAMSNKQTQVKVQIDQSVEFSARRKKYKKYRRHYARRGGKCDGFQRCRCGTTAARRHGLPYAYKANGRTYNLKLAIEWRHAFPRTSFQAGAVGVRPGHVLTVVSGSSCARATVYDDAGTYQRNICNMTFHSVSGSGFASTNESYSATRRSHKRSHRYAEAARSRF